MRRLLPVLALIAAVLVACAPASSATFQPTPIPTLIPIAAEPSALRTLSSCRPGTFDLTLLAAGQERRFRLHIPGKLANPPALVFAMHGYGGNPVGMEEYSGFSKLSDKDGFIVVYPQAVGDIPAWNLEAGQNLDITFFNALIDDLLLRCPIEPGRVFAVGHSRGGGMSNRLACSLSERVSAVGSVAGAFGFWQDCQPTRPVAFIAIHGLQDTTVPYNGRPKLPTNAYSTPPVREWAAKWAERNGCLPNSDSAVLSDAVRLEQWTNCSSQATVALYTLEKSGHEWPFSPVNASQAIWDFFKRH